MVGDDYLCDMRTDETYPSGDDYLCHDEMPRLLGFWGLSFRYESGASAIMHHGALLQPNGLEMAGYIVPGLRISESKINDRLNISALVPGVIAFSLERVCIDILELHEEGYTVGQLDLAANTAVGMLQTFEELGGEDIPADCADVRGCILDPGLLDDIVDAVE